MSIMLLFISCAKLDNIHWKPLPSVTRKTAGDTEIHRPDVTYNRYLGTNSSQHDGNFPFNCQTCIALEM